VRLDEQYEVVIITSWDVLGHEYYDWGVIELYRDPSWDFFCTGVMGEFKTSKAMLNSHDGGYQIWYYP
jgi:hypothetical protein